MSEYPEHQEFIDMILGIKKQPTASNKEDDTYPEFEEFINIILGIKPSKTHNKQRKEQ